MRLRNVIGAGSVTLFAVAGLAGPASAAPAAAAHPATAKTDKCSVHVNIAHPVARDYETLTVTSTAAKTAVQVTIKYKTVTHVWKFTTPASTKTTYRFNVGHPTRHWRVTLAGKVTGAPRGYKTGATCSTSFIPY
jgi:hypothetical protein